MEYEKFSSIPRLYRDVCITEKIDGMNMAVIIEEVDSGATMVGSNAIAGTALDGKQYFIGAQSRTQMLHLGNDQYGFAAWVFDNMIELIQLLGPGRHHGEWWGKGIQRSYHQKRRWFSLFNTKFWTPENTAHIDGLLTVPVLYSGPYEDWVNQMQLHRLETQGSFAAQQVDDRKLDFRPEGIVGWHTAMNIYYKVTLNGDGHKGAAKQAAEARKEKLAGYPQFMKLIGEK